MNAFSIAGTVIGLLFFLCHAHQLFYMVVPGLRQEKPHKPAVPHRLAVLIAARNEEAVVGQLLDSIRAQEYAGEPVSVCVVADNCTDATAAIAREKGALVYEREDRQQVGKGYALHWLLECLESEGRRFDAYLVLDADNLLAPGFLTAMNQSLSDGYEVVTCYRNSKNYGDNWISAGYALWFLRDSQFLNRSRHRLGTSCVVTGTGFAFTRAVLEQHGGWPYHCLTEDTEFSVAHICAGHTIGYCEAARLYDEQPVSFRQSWRQRMRWAKGNFQVFRAYGGRLLGGMAKGHYACFDAATATMPAFVLSVAGVLVNVADGVYRLITDQPLLPALVGFLQGGGGAYLLLLAVGALTLISEWRHIAASTSKKVWHLFTFPLFMLTYVPVAVAALFCRVEWKPIAHTRRLRVEDLLPPTE